MCVCVNVCVCKNVCVCVFSSALELAIFHIGNCCTRQVVELVHGQTALEEAKSATKALFDGAPLSSVRSSTLKSVGVRLCFCINVHPFSLFPSACVKRDEKLSHTNTHAHMCACAADCDSFVLLQMFANAPSITMDRAMIDDEATSILGS